MRRLLSFAIFGACYTGCFQYNLFAFLNEHVDGTDLLFPAEAAMQYATAMAAMLGVEISPLPEVTTLLPLLGAVQRTLINQLCIIPSLYYPLFFLITGLAYNLSLKEMIERARSLYLPLLQRNLAFWLPVQFAQFAFIEPAFQLPFVCACGLVWNMILSTVSLAQDSERKKAKDKLGSLRRAVKVVSLKSTLAEDAIMQPHVLLKAAVQEERIEEEQVLMR